MVEIFDRTVAEASSSGAFSRRRARFDTSGPSSMSVAMLSRLAASGGVAAQMHRAAATSLASAPTAEDALSVSETAVHALFGRTRAVILRVHDLPIQKERMKEWKTKTAQKAHLQARGAAVPDDFCFSHFFFTFQFWRDSVLDHSPISIFELEQWAWMYGRWAVADPQDMSHAPEFLHIMTTADEISTRLADFTRRLDHHAGLAVSESLRQEVFKLFYRFAAVRMKFVSETVAHALRRPELELLHDQMRTLERVYVFDHDTLKDFLRMVFDGLATQALMHRDTTMQDEYGSRAFLSIANAFIRGLKGFPAPKDPNPLDDGSGAAPKGGSKSASSIAPRGDPPACEPPPSPACVAPPAYTTVQQPIDLTATGERPFSADLVARQIASGHREAGPLLGGLSGGGAEGIDLYPHHRRVLHAQQFLHGIRGPGRLTSLPPPGLELPPLSTYPPPLPGAAYSALPYPGYVSPAYAATPAVSPYSTVQRGPTQGAGGAGGTQSNYSTGQQSNYATGQLSLNGLSDELFIPYSTGLLGSFSPYRAFPLPQNLVCFECGAPQQHFGNECPSRFARVRGEAPPGWKIGPAGAVAKDPAAWNGSDLSDAARAQYRDFLAKFSLLPHASYFVSVDEITGATPAPPRRPLPRSIGGGRRK
jgi:hypothetical protein